MTFAHGLLRLKWSLDWPVTPSVSDKLPMSSPSVRRKQLVALGCAIVLMLVLLTFHTTLGF